MTNRIRKGQDHHPAKGKKGLEVQLDAEDAENCPVWSVSGGLKAGVALRTGKPLSSKPWDIGKHVVKLALFVPPEHLFWALTWHPSGFEYYDSSGKDFP